MPISITMKFACRDLSNTNIRGLFVAGFFTPSNTDFGGKLSDIFIIFTISPKFYLSTRFFFDYFTNYGDGWSDVPPGPPADY